jgi:halimadienyl-diphosphate synthase
MEDFESLLKTLGTNHNMSHTSYDTASLALLGKNAEDLSTQALQWLSQNQLPDGSWGAKDVLYYHDRVICTLAAMIALTSRGRRAQDKVQIEKGRKALEWITSGATRGLASDPNGATVGFELIVPMLVEDAERLGIIKQQGNRILGRLSKLRETKMAKLSNLKINRYITPAFSAEMAGIDKTHLLDAENLQEDNGSVANSPSATAYFLQHIKPNNTKALSYLRESTTYGGAPFASPYDVFERAWILWNICLCELEDPTILSLSKPHIDFLKSAWRPDKGVGFAASYTPCDGDDTSVTFDSLAQFGETLNIDVLLNYEEKEFFRCYSLEANPSIGTNIHMLSAFKHSGIEKNHPSVTKIVNFLYKVRQENAYWVDKWHISPYYITSHAVIACLGYEDKLSKDSVEWILRTQKADGSWGMNISTAEETAYCIQALASWKRYGKDLPKGRIMQAKLWLESNLENFLPALWISKALYCPELVVRSAILSALILANKTY